MPTDNRIRDDRFDRTEEKLTQARVEREASRSSTCRGAVAERLKKFMAKETPTHVRRQAARGSTCRDAVARSLKRSWRRRAKAQKGSARLDLSEALSKNSKRDTHGSRDGKEPTTASDC